MTEIKNLSLNQLVNLCYTRSYDAGWYHNKDGSVKEINDGERLMLIVSEIGEAMEGVRKNLMDDHLPNRPMAEVEMADAIIRICDWCGHKGYDLLGAVQEKLEYNLHRLDHKKEERNKEGGKQF